MAAMLTSRPTVALAKRQSDSRPSFPPRPRLQRVRTPVRTRSIGEASITCHTAAPDSLAEACLPFQGPSCVLVSWDESAADEPGLQESGHWGDWLAHELGGKLVGVEASTSRAHVVTSAVRSANVVKGRIRANKIDLELELQGRHLKSTSPHTMHGSIRVVLKTEDHKDQICLSSVSWDKPLSDQANSQELAEIAAAAEFPLESALAIRLNDILWDVERHSLDTVDSMDTSA